MHISPQTTVAGEFIRTAAPLAGSIYLVLYY